MSFAGWVCWCPDPGFGFWQMSLSFKVSISFRMVLPNQSAAFSSVVFFSNMPSQPSHQYPRYWNTRYITKYWFRWLVPTMISFNRVEFFVNEVGFFFLPNVSPCGFVRVRDSFPKSLTKPQFRRNVRQKKETKTHDILFCKTFFLTSIFLCMLHDQLQQWFQQAAQGSL